MKKVTSVLMLGTLTLILGLFAAGCSSSKKEEMPTETPAVTQTAPEETAPVAQNDSLNLGASSAGRAH